MAGALGLEPRVPVLETGGLPINRYPYGVDSKNRTYMTRATIWRSAIELYQPYYLESRVRFELTNNRVAADALKPLGYLLIMVQDVGIEPTTSTL